MLKEEEYLLTVGVAAASESEDWEKLMRSEYEEAEGWGKGEEDRVDLRCGSARTQQRQSGQCWLALRSIMNCDHKSFGRWMASGFSAPPSPPTTSLFPLLLFLSLRATPP